ncbi:MULTISPECIES: hypothetical protein [unclassified Spiroplasma]|uniref:hypothetical protein n=1 Tax=unclassified Spiroplasma TaxID=2637901 RepID=UPI00313BECD2
MWKKYKINKLRLFFSCISIIMCVLTTTFLILCREWYSSENLLIFSIYICFCCYNSAFIGLFIVFTLSEISELINNKKQNKNKYKDENTSTYEIKNNLNNKNNTKTR